MERSLSHNILIYITHNDMDEARQLGKELVTKRLAACVNIIPTGYSIYSWNEEICEEQECIMIAKTHHSLFHEVERIVSDAHSYDNPAIISIPIDQMPDKYEQWLNDSLHLSL